MDDGSSVNREIHAGFCERLPVKLRRSTHQDNGFVLYYKSLAEERFHWPSDDDELITLNGEQLNWLLSGYNLSAMKPHRRLQYESTG